MLTPCFDVSQDDTFIIIAMRVPFVRATDAEFYIDGSSFKFYCKPYFLRLCLPGELIEDGRERAEHNIDKGTITVYVPKKNAGQNFDNLGMITSLLSNKSTLPKAPPKPLIEVLPGDDEEEPVSVDEDEEFDWQIEQEVPVDEMLEKLNLSEQSSTYGFAEQHSGVFTKLQNELPALVDCPDPDHMTSHERRVARLTHEETSFNPDHYLADLMESNEMIECLCHYQPPWKQQVIEWMDLKTTKNSLVNGKVLKEPDQNMIPFTVAEKMQLKELPNKEYILDKATERILYLGMIDIIFAYAYDYRITESEHNVESAWTICKLSSTLSWLEVFKGNVGEVVYCSMRRCLCYSLYRHWKLTQCVLQDTIELFSLGRIKLLQCLLAIRTILNSSEPYYVMNNLYINDYCVWIQKASAKQIQNLAQKMKQVVIKKSMIGWELNELEEAAQLVVAGDSTDNESSSSESSNESSETNSDNEGISSSSCNNETENEEPCSRRESKDDVISGTSCDVKTETLSNNNRCPTSSDECPVSEIEDTVTSTNVIRVSTATSNKLKEASIADTGISNKHKRASTALDEPTATNKHREVNTTLDRNTSYPKAVSTRKQLTSEHHDNCSTTTLSCDSVSDTLRDLLTLKTHHDHTTSGHTLIQELN